MVVAFGGDGTVNEAANGLARLRHAPDVPARRRNQRAAAARWGSRATLSTPPSTCCGLADDFQPRADGPRSGERAPVHLLLGRGAGRQRRGQGGCPPANRRRGWASTTTPTPPSRRSHAATSCARRTCSVDVGGRQIHGVTVVVQNSDPYTYFGRRPIRIGEGPGLQTGTLGLTVLSRATPLELPTMLWRAFSGNAATVARHRQIEAFPGVLRRADPVDRRPAVPGAGGRRLHRRVRGGRVRRRAAEPARRRLIHEASAADAALCALLVTIVRPAPPSAQVSGPARVSNSDGVLDRVRMTGLALRPLYRASLVRHHPPRKPALAPQAHGSCPACGSDRMVAGPARWSHRCEECGHGGMPSASGDARKSTA